MEKCTVVSAPGKVLLTGGYLVLQRPFGGLVLSLSSRFHAKVEQSGPVDASTRLVSVRVDSPQFDTVAHYEIVFGENGQIDCKASNPYVSNALKWALAFARHRHRPLGNLHVTVVADNDFYSMLDELNVRKIFLCFFFFFFFFFFFSSKASFFASFC